MSNAIDQLTDETFSSEITTASEPYLVEFWTEWCAPCVAIQPILEEIASEQTGKVRIGKVNIVEQPLTTEQFEVKTVPTIIIFHHGEPVKRLFGAKGKRQLLQALDEITD